MEHRPLTHCYESKKRMYSSKKSALGAVKWAESVRGVALTVYRCRDCGLWHLTSQSKEEQLTIRSKRRVLRLKGEGQ